MNADVARVIEKIVLGPVPARLCEPPDEKKLYSWGYHRAESQAKRFGLDEHGIKIVARRMGNEVRSKYT